MRWSHARDAMAVSAVAVIVGALLLVDPSPASAATQAAFVVPSSIAPDAPTATSVSFTVAPGTAAADLPVGVQITVAQAAGAQGSIAVSGTATAPLSNCASGAGTLSCTWTGAAVGQVATIDMVLTPASGALGDFTVIASVVSAAGTSPVSSAATVVAPDGGSFTTTLSTSALREFRPDPGVLTWACGTGLSGELTVDAGQLGGEEGPIAVPGGTVCSVSQTTTGFSSGVTPIVSADLLVVGGTDTPYVPGADFTVAAGDQLEIGFSNSLLNAASPDPTAPPAAAATPTLPATGGDAPILPAAAAGVLLLAAGAVLSLRRRPRNG